MSILLILCLSALTIPLLLLTLWAFSIFLQVAFDIAQAVIELLFWPILIIIISMFLCGSIIGIITALT